MMVCDKPTDLPRIRTECFPVVAVLLADRISVLVLVVLLGLNDTVTPAGKPEADNVTLELKPFCGVTVMVDVTLPPCVRLNEFGDADNVKFGRSVTVSETVVVCDKLPDVPVMVTVTVPRAAASPTVSVSVLVAFVFLGLNVAVTPVGRPESEKLTVPLKPFNGLTNTPLVTFAPWATLRLLGEAVSV